MLFMVFRVRATWRVAMTVVAVKRILLNKQLAAAGDGERKRAGRGRRRAYHSRALKAAAA